MPIGIIVCVLAVVAGGLLGTALGHKLPDRIKSLLTLTFGCCAMTMGIFSIIQMRNMPPVILSVILGAVIGSILRLTERIKSGVTTVTMKLFKTEPAGAATAGSSEAASDNGLLITAIMLFCFSSTGIYGSLVSSIDGDHSILLAKAILDLFTAMIFACELKQTTALIALPELVIMLLLFFSAKLFFPLIDEVMIGDFKACGGIILLATGLTILKLRIFPLADYIPAMILVMPLSHLWTAYIAPLL